MTPKPIFARREAFAWGEILQTLGSGPAPLVLALVFLLGLGAISGCRPGRPFVVVYAAQDRVFAEPLFAAFTRETGIEVRPVYDNEATKTTGLANRLLAEAARPQADVWWSNEEMRTRQLLREGVLDPPMARFGQRARVLVVRTNTFAPGTWKDFDLAALTRAEFRGQVALAYPLFGTTAGQFLVLRQRLGEAAWQAWGRALMANRPWLVDGNSRVVQAVARGDARVGLTDSDDVRFAQREGLPVVAIPLSIRDGLEVPNTVARVRNAPHRDAAERLREFLTGPTARAQLIAAGALDPESTAVAGLADPSAAPDWEKILAELDPALSWLQAVFVRTP